MVEKLVEDVKLIASASTATPEAIPDSAWETAVQTFIVGRYDRVQAAAQTWLTIMTALFGVFSTVVVVSGAKTISNINGGLSIGLVAVTALVFVLAFAAMMYGLLASWGGLGAALHDNPKEPAVVTTQGTEARSLASAAWQKLKDIPQELKDIWQELKDMWSPKGVTEEDVKNPRWENYRDYTLDRANKNRQRLHRSRVLGVAAVACVGLLGLSLIFNGVID